MFLNEENDKTCISFLARKTRGELRKAKTSSRSDDLYKLADAGMSCILGSNKQCCTNISLCLSIILAVMDG